MLLNFSFINNKYILKLKILLRIVALALILISCKEISDKRTDSNKLEEAKNILTENSSYSKTVRNFSDFLCDCIETKETTDNIDALNSRYDYCALRYSNDYRDELSELVLLLDSKLEENHGGYEVGKTTGNVLAREGNIVLARDCKFFQTEFEKIKHIIVKSLDSNLSNYNSKIQILEKKIKESKSETEIQQLTSIIGVTYELNDKYVEARQAYQRGAELESKQNINKIFLELLKAKQK